MAVGCTSGSIISLQGWCSKFKHNAETAVDREREYQVPTASVGVHDFMPEEKDRCKNCQGRKTTKERKILEVHIVRGMKDGQKITFTGEGDQEPGIEPGDIIIILDEKEHPLYKRDDLDLLMKMEIDLVEALCGFQKTIEMLDKRQLLITSHPGELIKPGKCLA
ncbi:mitochondrial protein import protein MAS5 [Desmophyllum pertusum]|uniref:Mitochondrial protein import protein MAS5 n=1 Tax=Desmophyllum pertusum TaxID=174260 RepID=A0A9W9ZLZ1_9CNID|nr:mitochondrial protein import protein MAS5 [Desmophyllum pertusum]